MALDPTTKSFIVDKFPAYADQLDSFSALPGFDEGMKSVFERFTGYSSPGMGGNIGNMRATALRIIDTGLKSAATDPIGFVKNTMKDSVNSGDTNLLKTQIQYLQTNKVPLEDIKSLYTSYATQKAQSDADYATFLASYNNQKSGGLFGEFIDSLASLDPTTAISRAATDLFQPIEQTISQNLAQLDKDLSLSQNAPLIATIAASVALPGVGASIGNSLLSAGLLPVGTTVATATAVGSGLANAALQVAQGKSPEDALKAGVIGAAGGAVGSYLVGDPGTLKNFVTSTSTNLLAGKNPEDAVKAGITSSGAGLAGRTVAGETGSAVAGQVAAGTTAGLLTGKTVEQALIRGVGNIKVDGLTSSIPPSTTAFDTTTDISDTSGFDIPTPTPQTPITGNTGGNMATYDDEMNAPATELQDTTPYNYSPEEQQLIYQLAQEAGGTQNISDAYAALTQAAQQTANQSGLTVGNVLSFFKKNPSLTKGLVTAGVSAAGGLLTNQANVEAARISAQAMRDAAATAAEAQKFRPVGVTTRFGASQFGFDPTTGQLTSAGYQLTPELKAMQDRIMALSGQGLTEAEQAAGRYAPLTAGAQGLFGLGQQYLAQSPEQVAADYMARQQNLLAPSRERQLAQLQNQLFQTGRGGLSVGATGMRPSGAGGLGAASPEMEAYYNALAQQDAQLAAQATQAGQQQVQFGAGLLGSGAGLLGSYTQGLTGAYAPFSTGVGVGSSLESLGQAPLDIGAQLGGRSAQAGANVGQTLLQGGLLGARTTQAASGVSPFGTALTGLANSPEAQQALLGMFTGGSPDQYEQRAGVPFTQRNVYG